jgi:hypothetical protein
MIRRAWAALRVAAVVALTAALAASGTYVALRPAQKLNDTQSAVLAEYLAAFCRPDDRHDKSFLIGQAAAMSRIVVRSRLGVVALAEYTRCRAGLSSGGRADAKR